MSDHSDICKIRACLRLITDDVDGKVILTGESAKLVADVIGAAEVVTRDTGNKEFTAATFDAWCTLQAAFASPSPSLREGEDQ